MVAYIVGMIVGTVVTVFPLVYLMNFDRCVAEILARQPDFDPARFDPSYSSALVPVITVIGAVVLLLSAAMMAITGLRRLGPRGKSAQKAPESSSSEFSEL